MTERGITPAGLKNDPAAQFSLSASAPKEEPLPGEVHTDDEEPGTATQDGREAK